MASSREATDERLWGVWLADAAPDNPTAPAVRRLRLWTVTPLFHARRLLGGGYQKILGLPGPRLGYADEFVRDHPDYFECRTIEPTLVCVDFADAPAPPKEGAPGADGRVATPVFTHGGLTFTAVATIGPGPDGRPCLSVRGKLHVRFAEPVVRVRVDFGDDPRLSAARGRVTASRAPGGVPGAPCEETVPFEITVDSHVWTIEADSGLHCLELARPTPVAAICFVTSAEAARAVRASEQCARNTAVNAHLGEVAPMLEPGLYYRLIVGTLVEATVAPSGPAASSGPATWPAGRYRLALEYRRNLGDEAGPGPHRFDRPVQTRLSSDAPDHATIDWTA